MAAAKNCSLVTSAIWGSSVPSGCSVPLVGSPNEKSSPEPWSMGKVRRAIPTWGTPLANKIAPLHAQFCQAPDPNFSRSGAKGRAFVRINAARTVTNQAPEGFDDPILRRFFGSGPSAPPSGGEIPALDSLSNGQILTNACGKRCRYSKRNT